MKLGLFFGIFDPIHLGHLNIIQVVREQTNLNEILVIPTNIPPHRSTPFAEFMQRCRMIKDALNKVIQDPKVTYNMIEAVLPQPNYTINTLNYFKQNIPDDLFYLIMGSDEWNVFPTWHRAEEIYALCEEIVVVQRANIIPLQHEKFTANILSGSNENISSSGIREQICKNPTVMPMGLVPITWKYIQKNHLYETDVNISWFEGPGGSRKI